jgi:hypothetical protein
MKKKLWSILAVSALTAVALPRQAHVEEALPNLSGTYRCEPDPLSCQNSGQTFTLTQSGDKVLAKNDKGETGQATLTSKISLSMGPPWNTLGIILPDNRTIEWSAGTKWRRE